MIKENRLPVFPSSPIVTGSQNRDSQQVYEALRKSEERYRELVEHANSIIMRCDRHGKVTSFNEYAQQLFGYSEAEIIGRHLIGTIVPASESSGRDLRQLIQHVCDHPQEHRYNINENITKSGKRVWIAWTNKILSDENGSPTGILSIGTDITKQRLLEEELRQAQKMQAIGELAGGIAHDFNNMIHGISGYAEVIQQIAEDPRISEYTNHILTTARHAAELTKQLLTFARKGNYQLKDCNTHEITRDVCAMLERTIDRRIRIEQQLEAGRPHVVGDPAQLKSALLNIGINAKDAMPGGGILRFSSSNITFERTTTIADFEVHPGHYLLITIHDSGTGMPPEVRRRIFEPFFTTKECGRGAGLGLAAVHGTIHLHKGAIQCHSIEGKGSTFNLYLPIAEAKTSKQQNQAESLSANRQLRIMVVDDEAIVRSYSKTLFEMNGHKVNTFASAEQAITYYRQHYEQVDLIILDMIMPGMDGQELFAFLRRINPNVKALLSTGFSVDSKVQEVIADGVLDCIQKPFTYDRLSKKIEELILSGQLLTPEA
ncbi:PAS domain S-box protein [Microbulbifer variabilis]|uniref:hybrid sensor histidine kinase/response regulator n=1 Tax=Microbulbifer variabilis TaxID=266805 RepID=UPI001CFE3FC6|nr:PAS domain-containing sensor histidine kinase [Microbulbifer variabilis]